MAAASPFDALSNVSTLGGVVVGGLVATLGAFTASWYERRMLRREREADAALVFGELLRTLGLQLALLRSAHGRGDPFGPITIRMARGARREVEIYDRNRERVFLIRDAELRLRVGSVIGRLAFALDRLLDNTDALATSLPEAEAAELKRGRDQSFGFLVECAGELAPLVERFAALAKTRIAEFDLASIGFDPPSDEP